jgi:hypothetical protein
LNALRERLTRTRRDESKVRPPSDLMDLVGLNEAAAMTPSHIRGKRVHVNTLKRWIYSGRLPGIRRGIWWFVSPADLKALYVPTLPTQIQPAAKTPDETIARLVKMGIKAVTPEERERLIKKGLLPKPQASPVGARRARR